MKACKYAIEANGLEYGLIIVVISRIVEITLTFEVIIYSPIATSRTDEITLNFY